MFREGQTAGEVRADLAAGVLAATFESMLHGAVLLWLNHPETDLKHHFDVALDLVLHGVAAGDVPVESAGAAVSAARPRVRRRRSGAARKR
jgi:hypothetical protein